MSTPSTDVVFGRGYAEQYDKLYAEKDYRAECDLIEAACQLHGTPGGKRLLDIGCGTGGHTIELASRGWTVAGVDPSPSMLQLARAKALRVAAPETISFLSGDAQSFEANGTFDVALMMFAVIGYVHENKELQRALTNVRRHLSTGGLFLFDCWYGPAVLSQRPGDRMRVIAGPETETTRFAQGSLDALHHLASIRYRVLETAGDRVISDAREVHTMRFFFPQELVLLLEAAGFELLSISVFPSLDVRPTESDWNVFVAARAR